jgi:Bacterial Ig domain
MPETQEVVVTTKALGFRFSFASLIIVVAFLVLVPAAVAGKGHGGASGAGTSSSCVQAAPAVVVQNNYAWGSSGSWGLPGQQLGYDLQVLNYDVGCGSSSFVVSVSAPSGFSVSMPTNTISLASGSSGYLWAYVTSSTGVADGDYPLTVTVGRVGASAAAASATTYYKLYSSDTTAPTLFWSNPGDGTTISGNSYMVTVSSSDDHAVKKIDLLIDGAYKATVNCDNTTYICQLSYKWSLSHARGKHTATFRSYDWLGNVGASTVSFTVSR